MLDACGILRPDEIRQLECPEPARRLAGLEEGVTVDYRIGEQRFSVRNPVQAVARGIVYLTEDRKRDGLFAGLSVLRNASAATLGSLSRLGFVDGREERRRVVPMLERLKVVAASLRTPSFCTLSTLNLIWLLPVPGSSPA